ncbi:IS701 family transposase [Streptomyces litchfieldiae]|uniref:Transposase n=1 Tax=Streptomyces litchfieldiae TaxID=3075543 RepID=A0ABU2MYD5_9ACTN|nr:transposase [Streptomyces sp. DSM 44938]MDT0345818.1 transposase [Streptomyces sp. DSM 44938]
MSGTTLIAERITDDLRSPLPHSSWWDDGALAELGSVLFASLPRSDQRRKGMDYLRGLLGVRGRRSIRNIATLLGGSATEQSLHHFVCSSTWDWGPVRQALARHLVGNTPPLAWVVQPMVIPKAGENSVGVDRQYVPEVGRILNAQRAVGIWAANEQASSPVNWRIYLSSSWLEDGPRRRQASIPEHLDARTAGDMTIDACLETAGEWGLPTRPVVVDARSMDIPTLVRRFRAAGVPFLARVNSTFQLTVTDPARLGRSTDMQPAGQIMVAERNRLRPVVWREHHGGSTTMRTNVAFALRVRLPHQVHRASGADSLALLGVGEDRRRWPTELWLTDMTDVPLPALVTRSKLTARTERDLRDTADRLGIRDFTGRSYSGWHRHVTLASAAHVVSVLGNTGRR